MCETPKWVSKMSLCYCHLSVPSLPLNSGQIATGDLSFSLSYCSQSNLFDVSLIQGTCIQCSYFLPSLLWAKSNPEWTLDVVLGKVCHWTAANFMALLTTCCCMKCPRIIAFYLHTEAKENQRSLEKICFYQWQWFWFSLGSFVKSVFDVPFLFGCFVAKMLSWLSLH